jgi:hypothetical protein
MKILNLKNVMSVLTCLALTLAVAAPSVSYAGPWHGDKGKRHGWSKEHKGKGKHYGWRDFHKRNKDRWEEIKARYEEKHGGGSEPSGGEEWTVQVYDFALEVGTLMSFTVNSLTTVQDLMDTAAGGSAPDGVYLRDCIHNVMINDCTSTDTDGALDPSLSLEASSVENEEVLYLLM